MEAPDLTQILVVEDNADDSFILTRQLAKAQIDDHVTVIEDGKKAFDFLLKAQPKPLAIFLDLHLHGLSGLQLLATIREESSIREVPVIIMTGSSDPKHEDECRRLGITAYLAKPVALTTFIKTVAHLFPKIASPT
jgi:chemotaxis family two-component system response regulator Rcp1